ncbi:MAG: hypothetical protein K8T10_15905 [Candidatus Eremiobacteraeota bacterium]|nr:hypothetical protein [Candidatus Eremiobacteraeota bacterium]
MKKVKENKTKDKGSKGKNTNIHNVNRGIKIVKPPKDLFNAYQFLPDCMTHYKC